jgi:drug/metabolite transporter (DMT)-like permease
VIYVNLNPMVATVLGAALLAETITPLFLIGFLAVGIGIRSQGELRLRPLW